MSFQTETRCIQPLEFTLCAQQKVLCGLELPGPGEGGTWQEHVELEAGKNMLIEQHILLCWAVT